MVGIADDTAATHRGIERSLVDGHGLGLEVGEDGLEIAHLEADGGAVRSRSMTRIRDGDHERPVADVVLDPLILPVGGDGQAKHLFIKRAGDFDVGDGVNDERDVFE